MTDLHQILSDMRDEGYASFQSRLTPGIATELFIGIRIPVLRTFAKEYITTAESQDFLQTLPHRYYDENMLHGLLISIVKDYNECMALTEAFLPYIDNWAVCDIMSPKVFGKHKQHLLPNIRKWCSSSHTYTCRFGLGMLMRHFLDKDFKPEYHEIAASIKSEEYYVRMMVAWYFATALAKQWDRTITYITKHRLGEWVHNKTIRKACESYRITPEQKDFLRRFIIRTRA